MDQVNMGTVAIPAIIRDPKVMGDPITVGSLQKATFEETSNHTYPGHAPMQVSQLECSSFHY